MASATGTTVALVVRTFSGGLTTLMPLLRSCEIFWPIQRWPVVVVLDANDGVASELDQQMALAWLPSWVQVAFEDTPPHLQKWRPLYRSGSRNLGVQRVSWSWFNLDKYTTSEFIAEIDADNILHTWVEEGLLFDEHGRPRITGNTFRLGADPILRVLGLNQDMDFMAGQPMVLRRKAYAETRAFVTERMQAADFDAAFARLTHVVMQNESEADAVHLHHNLCQQSTTGAYLWEYRRHEYSWHIMWHQSKDEIRWASGKPYAKGPELRHRCPMLFVSSHLSCWGVGIDCIQQKEMVGNGTEAASQGGQAYLARASEVLVAALCMSRSALLSSRDAELHRIADQLMASASIVQVPGVVSRTPGELCSPLLTKYSEGKKMLFGIMNYLYWLDTPDAPMCPSIPTLHDQWTHVTRVAAQRYLASSSLRSTARE